MNFNTLVQFRKWLVVIYSLIFSFNKIETCTNYLKLSSVIPSENNPLGLFILYTIKINYLYILTILCFGKDYFKYFRS